MSFPSANEAAVPCNGCTLCCQGDAIRLLPEDDASQYQTVPHDWMEGHLMLDHKLNGDCIYLGEAGCTIHERKPLMCRQMDCRTIAQRLTYSQARGARVMLVWRKGKSLLKAAA